MALSNTTTLNDLIGSIVSANAQSAAYANRVFRQLVRGEAIPPGFKTLTIPRFDALTISSLTEGVAPSSTTLSTTGVTLTPVEYGVYVQISKMALHADPWADLSPYGDQIGRAMAAKEDALVIAQMDFSTTVNTAADALVVDDFVDAIGILEAANAPGPYAAVMHPLSWAKVRKEVDVQGYGSQVGELMVNGFGPGVTNMNSYVGSLFGVPVFISSQVGTDDGATPSKRHNVVFSREAIGCGWIKDIGIDVDDNIVSRAFDLMGWFSFDCEKLVDEYGVLLLDTLT